MSKKKDNTATAQPAVADADLRAVMQTIQDVTGCGQVESRARAQAIDAAKLAELAMTKEEDRARAVADALKSIEPAEEPAVDKEPAVVKESEAVKTTETT